ncbi:TPA: hypothetical protein KEY82_000025 [Staphylococcus aureus]|nr:hypothetical protein [Staphylococcus aureus]
MDFQFLQTMQVGVWAPTQRISKRNSTGNASWGVGANTEAYEKSAYNNVQVGGAPTKRNWIPNFYSASWGETTIK